MERTIGRKKREKAKTIYYVMMTKGAVKEQKREGELCKIFAQILTKFIFLRIEITLKGIFSVCSFKLKHYDLPYSFLRKVTF